jgi:TonB family protein
VAGPGAAAPVAAAPGQEAAVPVAKPVVVPPRLIYFHEAVYPEAARKQKLAADVPLRLVIEVDGSVGKAEVLEPVGNGLDEAAVEAAKRFVFTPAQRNGVAVAAAIQYLYRFSAEGAEEGVDLGTEPSAGNLEGVILISDTDVPLAGAVVTIQDVAGARFETVTDAKGHWSFSELPAGSYQVTVAASGFESVSASEDVAAGEATAVTYRVAEPVDAYEVVVRGERPPREVTRRTLVRREVSRVPGTGGDALRSLQSLPGVARPPGLAGLLIVRGSAPEDTNTFVDGALVPLIYHFGGLSSVVPTELLDRIDFYPGNFSAKYGRVMGGVVDVGLRSPDTECRDIKGVPTGKQDCIHGLAQVDLIDTRVLLQAPLGGKWSIALGGRRSWVDLWLKPVLEEAGAGVTAAPVYFDYQVILERKASEDSRFRVQVYGADDALKILINNPSAQEPGFGGQLSLSTAFYRIQAIYQEQLTKDWDLYTTVGYGRDVVSFGIGPAEFRLDAGGIEMRSELGYEAMPGLKFTGGLDFLTVPVYVHVRAPEPPRPGEPDPGPFTNRPILETRDKTTAFRPGWYLEAEAKPTARWLLVPGFRVDFARDTGHPDFDPRLNSRYSLITAEEGGGRKTTLKGGVGLYSQPPQFQETDEVFGSVGLYSNRALHVALGVEQDLTTQIELGVEGYYKGMTNLVSRGAGPDGSFDYNNEGTGQVMGLETLLKYKPDDRFFGWLAYTLSRSTRKNGPGQDEYLFQFDQTHVLTVLGSYRLGGGWEVGSRFRLVSGNPYTPVAGTGLPAVYSADSGSYAALSGAPFSRRLPLFHQLDIRVEKNWQFAAWRLMTYLDVWNAYNHAAVEDVQYNFNFTRTAAQTGLPIIPSLGVRGEF